MFTPSDIPSATAARPTDPAIYPISLIRYSGITPPLPRCRVLRRRRLALDRSSSEIYCAWLVPPPLCLIIGKSIPSPYCRLRLMG